MSSKQEEFVSTKTLNMWVKNKLFPLLEMKGHIGKMHKVCVVTLLILWTAVMCASSPLSTTENGDLQALAQGPSSIALYWRHAGKTAQVNVNGQPAADLQPDAANPFACHLFTNLQPSTQYSFSLTESGFEVAEKTWSELPECGDFDLLVIGGTASGVAAAVSAARLGLRVALVEETNRLGGMSSNGLGSTDIRNFSRANGFFRDFIQRVYGFYGKDTRLRYESRVANAIFKAMVYEQPNISLFLKSKAARPIMEGDAVRGAVVQDSTCGSSGEILARITIDATDTADFAAAAGADYRIGREQRTANEPHSGMIYFNNADQEILPGSTGEADCKHQSYAYLMIWKDYGEMGELNAPLIEQPRFYDPENYRHSPEWEETWNYTSGRLPNGKFEINQHPFGIDWPGINYDYPTADEQRRREIEEMYRDRALGYLYFMQNERGHKNLGLADDEFPDNCNFPTSLYVREARRVMGNYLFQESDVTNARDFCRINSVAIGDYPMDSHAMEDLKDPNAPHKGEGEFWLVDFTPWYQIPYGVLVPNGVKNLLVATAVSATHVGYGTLRMEPVRMALGQAAGAAAYYAMLYSIAPEEVKPAWIQDKILSQDAYITWYSDVDRDTRHFEAIQFMGARGMFPGEAFNPAEPLTQPDAFAAINRLLELEGCPATATAASDNSPITRGEFANLLVAAKQRTSHDWVLAPECPAYTDVPQNSPYYTAVETLKSHRITSALFANYEPGKFQPDAPINRADAAEAIYLAHRPLALVCPHEPGSSADP